MRGLNSLYKVDESMSGGLKGLKSELESRGSEGEVKKEKQMDISNADQETEKQINLYFMPFKTKKQIVLTKKQF